MPLPPRPMIMPGFDNPKYRELRTILEKGFAELDLPFETGSFKVPGL